MSCLHLSISLSLSARLITDPLYLYLSIYLFILGATDLALERNEIEEDVQNQEQNRILAEGKILSL